MHSSLLISSNQTWLPLLRCSQHGPVVTCCPTGHVACISPRNWGPSFQEAASPPWINELHASGKPGLVSRPRAQLARVGANLQLQSWPVGISTFRPHVPRCWALLLLSPWVPLSWQAQSILPLPPHLLLLMPTTCPARSKHIPRTLRDERQTLLY